MSASRTLSGNAAEPIFTEPGWVGSAPAEAADVLGGVELPDAGGLELPPPALPELPLLPQAASTSRPMIATAPTTAAWMRFMVLLAFVRSMESMDGNQALVSCASTETSVVTPGRRPGRRAYRPDTPGETTSRWNRLSTPSTRTASTAMTTPADTIAG